MTKIGDRFTHKNGYLQVVITEITPEKIYARSTYGNNDRAPLLHVLTHSAFDRTIATGNYTQEVDSV